MYLQSLLRSGLQNLICDFLLVINFITYLLSCTVFKLWPIIGQIFASDRGSLHFNTIARGDPCQYPDIRINFTSPETRMIVLSDAGNCTIVSSFVWNVSDRRTDRQPLAITAVGITSGADAL